MSNLEESINNSLPSLINPDTGLSEREEYFLDILFDQANGDIPYAMKLAGYPTDTSANQLRKKLAREIKEATKNYLISQTPGAAVHLSKILREPTLPGAKNVIDAAKQILDRGDVVQDTNKTNELPRNIIVLLPPKDTQTLDLERSEYRDIDE